MAKARQKRQGPPTWTDYIRSQWGRDGGCPVVTQAREFAAALEQRGKSVAQIWRMAARDQNGWVDNVYNNTGNIVYAHDAVTYLDELDSDWPWSKAFKAAVAAERKLVANMAASQDRYLSGKDAPTLVRMNNGRVVARFEGAGR